MPLYRLIADHGRPVAEFEAEDDVAAGRQGRERSLDHATARETGFRVERQADDGWSTVHAWMPHRVKVASEGRSDLVQAENRDEG